MSSEKKIPINRTDVLFRAHYRELCVFAFRFVEEMDEAEDLVQDIFMRLITKDAQLDQIENPRAYLYTAVRNACFKHLKKKGQENSTESQPDYLLGISPSIETTIIQQEKSIKLYEAIESLPPQCKKIFISCHIDQLKYKETAEDLELSINTVKTQMKKAFRLLRKALNEIYCLSVFSFFLLLPSF